MTAGQSLTRHYYTRQPRVESHALDRQGMISVWLGCGIEYEQKYDPLPRRM